MNNIINKKIALIGAGNVASHLAPALLKSGANLCQIYSRTPEAARELGKKTGITYTSNLTEIYPDCDIYIFCVKDDVLSTLFKKIRISSDALMLHTSGSLPMTIFSSHYKHYGVLYPLQSFTKKRELNFAEIPLCIEAVDTESMAEIKALAGILSDQVYEIDSEKRKVLHLAAVFANNFVNYMYRVAGDLLEKEQLDFKLLRPIIYETANKILMMKPDDAQTGPARRGDQGIISMHRTLLKDDPDLLKLYNMISDSIYGIFNPKIQEQKVTEEHTEMLSLW